MTNDSENLFRQYGIFDLIENLKVSIQEQIKSMPTKSLEGDAQSIAKRLAAAFSLQVPVLHEEKQYATEREVQLDVTNDPMSQFMHGYPGDEIFLNATEVTVSIPFDGDPLLFHVQPSTFSLNPVRGYVVDRELKLVFTVLQGRTNLKQQYEQSLSNVRQHLRSIADSAVELNSILGQVAVPTIVNRKLDLEARAAAVNSLGIPIRASVVETSMMDSELKDNGRKELGPTWDVFISHAHEDKDEIARPLAEALDAALLTVWFDEKALHLGDSLRTKIDEGLSKSTYGVIILSEHFFEKHWPQQELNGMAGREIDGKKVILPVWHRVGQAEVRKYSPILADRLAVSTDKGVAAVVQQIVSVVKCS